jgi:uncharacterized protein
MSDLKLREFHTFEAAGREFVYLVPSAAVFMLDEPASAVLRSLREKPQPLSDLVSHLNFAPEELAETIAELRRVRAIGETGVPAQPAPKVMPPEGFPLTTMVLNVTNQCNLSCTYCYEYGEDKIVDTENGAKPKFMSTTTAFESVDFMFKQSGANRLVHLTFFGGETLLNFPVLKATVTYARQKAEELGKQVDFSLTTNATLLRPEIIEWLVNERVGVTVSIDGPKEMQDQFRVFKNGTGSYDIVAPKIKALLKEHRSRPIGARVTLTSQTLDLKKIFRHLTEEIGFWEVGFAPVTTASNRDYAISDAGFDHMLSQFQALANEFLEHALENRHHGFSNVKDTLEEIHKGVSKAYPCGAGLGLMGVATDGDVALCHRFAGSEEHKLGTVRDGIDQLVQIDFLKKHHIDDKTDCNQCWARPLCAGGCYHEAHTRYGDTAHANLHYCEWIRAWTDTCLRIYGELAARNPKYLEQFDERLDYEASHVN